MGVNELGLLVGTIVGKDDGVTVGLKLGILEGFTVGALVGVADGLALYAQHAAEGETELGQLFVG